MVVAEQCAALGVGGVVCAAAPLAAQAGAAALRGGGNAYDAAVAAAARRDGAASTEVWIRRRSHRAARCFRVGGAAALLAIGGAPAGLAAVAADGAWREVGPMSVGPPAAARGYAALADLGRLGRERLAAPAIDLARDGFPWASVCARLSKQAGPCPARSTPLVASSIQKGTHRRRHGGALARSRRRAGGVRPPAPI